MKTYLIIANVVFEAPQFTFMIKADNKEKAREKARQIIKRDYPDWNEKERIEVYIMGKGDNLDTIKKRLLV